MSPESGISIPKDQRQIPNELNESTLYPVYDQMCELTGWIMDHERLMDVYVDLGWKVDRKNPVPGNLQEIASYYDRLKNPNERRLFGFKLRTKEELTEGEIEGRIDRDYGDDLMPAIERSLSTRIAELRDSGDLREAMYLIERFNFFSEVQDFSKPTILKMEKFRTVKTLLLELNDGLYGKENIDQLQIAQAISWLGEEIARLGQELELATTKEDYLGCLPLNRRIAEHEEYLHVLQKRYKGKCCSEWEMEFIHEEINRACRDKLISLAQYNNLKQLPKLLAKISWSYRRSLLDAVYFVFDDNPSKKKIKEGLKVAKHILEAQIKEGNLTRTEVKDLKKAMGWPKKRRKKQIRH